MLNSIRIAIALVVIAGQSSFGLTAAADDNWESTATSLQRSVVLVRVKTNAEPPRVSLSTGVAVAPNLIVTTAEVANAAPRITLPGGAQTQAKVAVVDEVSGLALLKLTEVELPALSLAEKSPRVGSWVMSASAYGAEPAAVSLGVVGGLNRLIGGGSLPPLMQCDVRSTNTSSGGPVVGRDGRVIAIVVAVEDDDARGGWTYGVPAKHVQRLLDRWRREAGKSEQPLVFKRERPVVGLVLDQEGSLIVVSRVHANSPAERAGLRVGDRILAVDGLQIRSVYQAVRPLLFKQPGDRVTYRLKREDNPSAVDVKVALGSQSDALANNSVRQPKLDVEAADGGYRATDGKQTRQLAGPDDPRNSPIVTTPQRQIELLEKALDGYRNVILLQQEQIRELRERLDKLEK